MNTMVFDIASRHMPCAIAQAIANTFDADQSAEDSPKKKIWHQEIIIAID